MSNLKPGNVSDLRIADFDSRIFKDPRFRARTLEGQKNADKKIRCRCLSSLHTGGTDLDSHGFSTGPKKVFTSSSQILFIFDISLWIYLMLLASFGFLKISLAHIPRASVTRYWAMHLWPGKGAILGNTHGAINQAAKSVRDRNLQ